MMKKKRKMRKTYQTMYNLMILEKKKYFGSGYPREGLAAIKTKRKNFLSSPNLTPIT